MVFIAQSPVDWLVDWLSDEKDDNYRAISSIYLLAVSPVMKWIWVTHTISHAYIMSDNQWQTGRVRLGRVIGRPKAGESDSVFSSKISRYFRITILQV